MWTIFRTISGSLLAKRFTTHAAKSMSDTQIITAALCSHKGGMDSKLRNEFNNDTTR
jgi:hypothetical protein